MLTLFVLAATLSSSPAVDVAAVQADIQGLYEDIRQMKAQSEKAIDVDDLHDVLYTADWTFVDKTGQSHSWMEMRQQQIDALAHKPPQSFYQPIKNLSLSSDGATAVVIITENGTTYKDMWVKSGDSWKMKTRREI